MKVLAIRGEHVASLHEPFEIDFTSPPLSEAGLFAIVGPTGAGKSTLLDAICLALYGYTPRVEGKGGPSIGREDDDLRLGARDPRSLLARGCRTGFVEVDFVGKDGGAWRARWWVRATRSGALGDASMRLSRLGAGGEALETVADGLSLTRAAILERLGFTFGEFQKAVVLPQGEFAEFLHADSRARAEILEKVTGARIYSRVGELAYRRAEAEQGALQGLLDEAERQAPLQAEARIELVRDREAAAAVHDAASSSARSAEDAVAWYARREALAALERDAAAEASRAADEVAAAAPLRAEIEAVKQALSMRAELEAARRAEEEASRAEAEARAREREAAAATTARATAEVSLAAALAAKAAEDEAASALAPAIDAARRLDVELHHAGHAFEEARAAADAARRVEAEARAQVGRLEASAAATDADIAASERWLADHAAEAPVAAEWSRWGDLIVRHGSASSEAARHAGTRAEAEQSAARAAETVRRATERLAEAGSRLEGSRDAVARCQDEVRRFDLAAIRAEREALALRRDALQVLAGIARAADADAAAREVAMNRGEEAARRTPDRHAAAARLADELGCEQARLGEARHGLDRARAEAGHDGARSLLRRGEACPLCGSLEHPWAGRPASGGPLASMMLAAEERIAALQLSCDALRAQREETVQGAALAEAAASAAREEVARRDAALSGHSARWVSASAAASSPLPPEPVGATGPVAAALVSVTSRVQEVRSAEAAAAAAQEALGHARDAAERAAVAVESARSERDRFSRQHDEAAAIAIRAADARAMAERERDGCEEGLAVALASVPGWREALRTDARRFARTWDGRIAAYEARVRARDGALARRAELASDVGQARARHSEREAGTRQTASVAELAERHRTGLARDRADLLHGRAVAEVEAECAERVDGAKRRAEAAREAHGVAEITLARAERARADAAKRRACSTAAQEKSRGALAVLLASRGVDRALALECLAKGERFASEGEARLRSLDDRATSTRATLDERRAARERHEVSGRPPLGLEEARAAVVTAAEEARAANERRLELEIGLRQDDERRDALAALLPRIEVQRARARRWAAISAVIGSGTGDRFRAFAQSLALETLLGYANQHLEQLSPRYRLMRVPGTDMELQILDRDLGDEVRSVNGLSGGETFLVSLGLALGLSALSTRAARVETLFIDEGFGTLDPDALDQAMVVLEGLRATGRTVGIISHVPELHERIGVLVKVEKTGAGRSTVRTVRLG